MMYIGYYYSPIFGRQESVDNLIAAHTSILKRVKAQRSTMNNEKMEKDLNELFYSKELNHFGISEEGIQAALKINYNFLAEVGKKSSRLANPNGFIDMSKTNTYIETNIFEDIENEIKILESKKIASENSGIAKQVKVYNMMKNFQSLVETIRKDAIENLPIQLEENIMKLDELIDLVNNEIDTLQKDYVITTGSKGGKGYSSKYYSSSKKGDKIQVVKSLAFWLSFLDQKPITTGETGDMAEAAVGVLAKIYKNQNEIGLQLSTQDALKMTSDILTGAKRTSSRNQIMIDVKPIDIQNYRNATIENRINSSLKDFWDITGYSKILYDSEYNRQIKTDVTFSVNDRASVKNWSNWSFKDYSGKKSYNSLGETSILFALLRTCGNDIAEDYIYAVQDNEIKYSLEGSEAIMRAHLVARASLIADIAMGLSQEATSANLLIINMRNESKWYVYNISDLIESSLYNKSIKNARIRLEGYDDLSIHNTAWRYMDSVLDAKTNISQRSNFYKALMYSYLHSIKVKALFVKN